MELMLEYFSVRHNKGGKKLPCSAGEVCMLWEEGPVGQHSGSSCAAQRQKLKGCGALSGSAQVIRVSCGSLLKLLLTAC